jgi:hypothetical protein
LAWKKEALSDKSYLAYVRELKRTPQVASGWSANRTLLPSA